MKLLIMCEGPNELKIINILLENQMIIRTYLDYPIEVVARKLKVRPNTVSKARRKIARELRKKLV